MPFFSISSLSDWTSFCCRWRRPSSEVTRPWKSALARFPASHSLSARCTSTYANFSSARAGVVAEITANNAPNIAPMNNRCLIQPGKPPVDDLLERWNASPTCARELYTIVLRRASNPVFWRLSRPIPAKNLQWRAGADLEHRMLIGRPRVNRESDIHRQRPEWRFPTHADSGRRLQIIEMDIVLEQERLSCVAEYHAADSQSRQDREGDFVTQQQFLAAADILHALRRAVLAEQRHLWTQRIKLIAAHVARSADAAREESLVQWQLAASAAFEVAPDAVSDSLRHHERAQSLALQERIEIPEMRDALDECVGAAESAELQAECLDGAGARIGRVIHREASYRRRELGSLRVALVALDLKSRELVQARDSDALVRVAQSGGDVFQREWAELLEAELGQRISRRQGEARGRLVEADQVSFVVEQLHADAQRDVEEPRLRVADAVVLEQEADLRIGDQRFAAAEEVGVAEREVAEQRLVAVEAARHLERGGIGLSHVHIQVDLVGLRGRRRRDARAAEETQPVQPHLRIANFFGAVRLLFLHLDFTADNLVGRLRIATDIDAVDQHFMARIDHEYDIDALDGRHQLRARIDVDVSVAAVRVEIRQRQHLPLEAGAAEQLPGLQRQQPAQLVARKFQIARDVDVADAVGGALVDCHDDRDVVAVAQDLRRRNLHVEVAVVVVKCGQPVDVRLQFLRIERAPLREPAQQPAVGPGLHVVFEHRRRKRVIADELDLRDLDLGPFTNVEFAERRVVGLRNRLEGHLGVGVALVRVHLLDVVDGLLDRDRIEDGAGLDPHRSDYLVVVRADGLHPVQLDVGNLRTLLDPVNQHALAALLLHVRAHRLEKAQEVDSLDVRSYRVGIERLADLLGDVDANRVFLDALIADDLNLGDCRLWRSLRARSRWGEHRERRQHREHQRAARTQ